MTLTIAPASLRWFAAPQVQALPVSGRATGMFKQALSGSLCFTEAGLVGDTQADRSVHGGPEKAVHFYPRAHLAALTQAFPELAEALQPGALGENLSVVGLDESDVHLGEVWQLGTAQLQVCQPRQPCWKLDDRLQTDGVAAFIEAHGLTGWYCRVLRAGEASTDAALLRHEAPEAPCLADARALTREHRPSLDALRGLAQTPGIAQEWAAKLIKRADYLARLA